MNLIFLLIPVILSMFFIPAFATTFSVDKSNYEYGDIVTLSGIVDPVDDTQLVSIQIINPPKSDLVQIDTFFPNSDGSFSRTYKAEGSRWNLDGIYTVKLIYNGEKLQTSLEFIRDPPSEPTTTTATTSEPTTTTATTSEPTTNPTHSSIVIHNEAKTHIPGFPSLSKTPQYYFDRYNNEISYKKWFDSQFPNRSIHQVIGYANTNVSGFPDNSKSPQYYFDRYNNEISYKKWFDSQFPNRSIHQVLGFPDPVPVPDWIKNNASWWSTGKINDKEFISGIQFMIQNNILIIPNLPETQISNGEEIPTWIKNNASWWALDKISEEEFVSGIKYLIQQGIISV